MGAWSLFVNKYTRRLLSKVWSWDGARRRWDMLLRVI